MSMIDELKTLVCEQVESFIANVMKEESDVDNGLPPYQDANGTGRIGQLQQLSPRHSPPSVRQSNTELYIDPNTYDGEDIVLNNNPEYPVNLIDRLNTPFDHLERILL